MRKNTADIYSIYLLATSAELYQYDGVYVLPISPKFQAYIHAELMLIYLQFPTEIDYSLLFFTFAILASFFLPLIFVDINHFV